MEAISRLIRTKIRDACLARPLAIDDAGSGRVHHPGADGLRRRLRPRSHRHRPRRRAGASARSARRATDGRDAGRDQLGTDLSRCAPYNESRDFWRYVPADQAPECEGRSKVLFEGAAIPRDNSLVTLECLSRVDT